MTIEGTNGMGYSFTRFEWEEVLGIRGGSAVASPARQTGDVELDALFREHYGDRSPEWRHELVVVLTGASDSDSRVGTLNDRMGEVTEDGGRVGLRTGGTSLHASIREFAPPDTGVLASDGAASRFWDQNKLPIALSLLFASLPAAYACADGAEVLLSTGEMSTGATTGAAETSAAGGGPGGLFRRVPHTGQFLGAVLTNPLFADGRVDANSDAYRAIRYVRVLHAAIRHWLTHPDRVPPWDQVKLGVPINQMDLAGTVLAFALVVDKPMRLMVIFMQTP